MGEGEKRLSKAGGPKPSPFCRLCGIAISEEAVSFEKEFTKWPGKSSDSNLSPNTSLCRIKKWECLRHDETLLGVRETSVVCACVINLHHILQGACSGQQWLEFDLRVSDLPTPMITQQAPVKTQEISGCDLPELDKVFSTCPQRTAATK